VIGTHRLLQKDIHFRELGIFILDEEQRFGVRHKEKLKKLRRSVDVLTLTATPIPRTLHLSLSGIRDISIISTPPEYRRSIITYVSEYSDGLVKEAIQREINRGGRSILSTTMSPAFSIWPKRSARSFRKPARASPMAR
jgi:transcription-repair coupling factor (superfamily II helicase)